MLSGTNRDVLRNLLGDSLLHYEIPNQPVVGFQGLIQAFRGHINGISDLTTSAILRLIANQPVRGVFIDGSNFGELARTISIRFPDIRIVTFFHNVESRFFWGSFKESKSLRYLAIAAVNFLAERKAVRYSQGLVCLNQRDSQLMRRLYGRPATSISPMILVDRLGRRDVSTPGDYLLFVGGNFYANRRGIVWFAENVVPHIQIRTVVVGSGMEECANLLDCPGKIEVVGTVKNLEPFYQQAKCVIAPIWDGSGMKTKVAEALMHGKKVIGTPEAFCGYEDIADQVGWVCSDAEQFINAVQLAVDSIEFGFDTKLRLIYEEKYSAEAGLENMRKAVGE